MCLKQTAPEALFKKNKKKTCFSHVQTFKRDGNDLFINHKIGLVEALCGCQFLIKHLDSRQIVVTYPAGKVIEPGQLLLYYCRKPRFLAWLLLSENPMFWRCLISYDLFNQTWKKCFSGPRLGQDGARRGHAAVQKPLWQGRSLCQVWCPVPSEQLDQPGETGGMRSQPPFWMFMALLRD